MNIAQIMTHEEWETYVARGITRIDGVERNVWHQGGWVRVAILDEPKVIEPDPVVDRYDDHIPAHDGRVPSFGPLALALALLALIVGIARSKG